MDVRRNFLMERVIRHWKGSTQGGLESPTLEVALRALGR